LTNEIRNRIFAPYLHALSKVQTFYRPMDERNRLPPGKRVEIETMGPNQSIRHMLDRAACALISILHRDYLVLRNGRIA
jgi:hypothetical protein